MKYRYLAALFLAVSIAPFGVAHAAQNNVSMVGMTFSPSAITIAANDTVVWTNSSSLQHTVTADDGSFDSGTVNAGSTYSHTFTTPGSYRYYCRFHGAPGGVGMSGTITVTAPSPQPNPNPAPNPQPNPSPNPNPNPQPYPSPTYHQQNYQQLYWCGTYYSYYQCPSMNMNYGNYNYNYNSNYNYNNSRGYYPYYYPYYYYFYTPRHSYYYNPYRYQTSYYPSPYYSYSYTYPSYNTQSNGYYSYWSYW